RDNKYSVKILVGKTQKLLDNKVLKGNQSLIRMQIFSYFTGLSAGRKNKVIRQNRRPFVKSKWLFINRITNTLNSNLESRSI
ncbi:MAG: hypothetical protein WCR53_06235, partial [Bacteroidaceae bacterium]